MERTILVLFGASVSLWIMNARTTDAQCNIEQQTTCRESGSSSDGSSLARGECSAREYVAFTHVCIVQHYNPTLDFCCCPHPHMEALMCCRYHQDHNLFRCVESTDKVNYTVALNYMSNMEVLLPSILVPVLVLTGCLLCCFRRCCCCRGSRYDEEEERSGGGGGLTLSRFCKSACGNDHVSDSMGVKSCNCDPQRKFHHPSDVIFDDCSGRLFASASRPPACVVCVQRQNQTNTCPTSTPNPDSVTHGNQPWNDQAQCSCPLVPSAPSLVCSRGTESLFVQQQGWNSHLNNLNIESRPSYCNSSGINTSCSMLTNDASHEDCHRQSHAEQCLLQGAQLGYHTGSLLPAPPYSEIAPPTYFECIECVTLNVVENTATPVEEASSDDNEGDDDGGYNSNEV